MDTGASWDGRGAFSASIGSEVEAIRAEALSAPHGFFTRAGGVSEGVYEGLQCGYGAKADPRENVDENRDRARKALEARALITAYQAHTPRALAVSEPWAPDDAPEADALATRSPGLAVAVLTADCAPVLLEDRETGVVGAAHAGWKGAINGVLEAVLDVMEALGAQRSRVRAVVGPTIGPASYEVGPEFVARLLERSAENAKFFGPPRDAASVNDGKAQFDLPAYVVNRLKVLGVGSAQWIGRDTYAEPDKFYSNRRALHLGEPDYGRLISVIRPPAD